MWIGRRHEFEVKERFNKGMGSIGLQLWVQGSLKWQEKTHTLW